MLRKIRGGFRTGKPGRGRAFKLQNWPAAVWVVAVNFVAIFEVGTPDPESVKGTEECEGSKERNRVRENGGAWFEP